MRLFIQVTIQEGPWLYEGKDNAEELGSGTDFQLQLNHKMIYKNQLQSL